MEPASAQESAVEIPQEDAPVPEEAPPPPPPQPEIIEFDIPTPNPGIYYIVYLPFTLKFMLFVIGFAAVNLGCSGVFGSKQYVDYFSKLKTRRHNLDLTDAPSDNFTWFCDLSKEVHENLTKIMKDKKFNETEDMIFKRGLVASAEVFYKNYYTEEMKGYGENFIPPLLNPNGRTGNSRSGEDPSNKTSEQEKWEEERRVRGKRQELEGVAAGHRRNCNNIEPSWVAVDYYFVIAAITCVTLEFFSLGMAVIFPDLTMKLRALDGGLHGALGVLIMAGSISLLVGMQIQMDDGVEANIWNAKQAIVNAERKYDSRKKELEGYKDEGRLNSSEFDKHDKWAKFRRDQEIKTAKFQEQDSKTEVGFNEKVSGASLGFVNAALYFFSAPIIGRGLTSIPLK